jgi:hypothetical protein
MSPFSFGCLPPSGQRHPDKTDAADPDRVFASGRTGERLPDQLRDFHDELQKWVARPADVSCFAANTRSDAWFRFSQRFSADRFG